MRIIGRWFVAALALLVPSVAFADELATVRFAIGDDYQTCLNRAQSALENEGATTIRQAGDIVYGDHAQWLVGIECEPGGEAVAVATAPDEQSASDWAARARGWYDSLVAERRMP